MLAGLQSGRFARALACAPTHAVYYFIPEQVARIAGRASWDTHGPRFALENDGPVRAGNFDTPGLPRPATPDLDEGILGWRRLLGVVAMGTPAEADLTAAVLVEAARELERLAPGAKLHVLFWTEARTPMMEGSTGGCRPRVDRPRRRRGSRCRSRCARPRCRASPAGCTATRVGRR